MIFPKPYRREPLSSVTPVGNQMFSCWACTVHGVLKASIVSMDARPHALVVCVFELVIANVAPVSGPGGAISEDQGRNF